MVTSDCLEHFTYEDFDLTRVESQYPKICPIRSCRTKVVNVPTSRGEQPFCSKHGIRLHSRTFVYWNGIERKDEARLRNFHVRPDIASEVALRSVEKAESHRLGYEMSEDALTWNVFVGLAEAGKLSNAVHFLTGREVSAEPDLYLWGELVDVRNCTRKRFEPLDAVRGELEKGIKRFKTEPDAMLVLDGKFIICVEAKFGSGNPLVYEGKVEEGQKPTDRAGLLQRYLDRANAQTKRNIDRNGIGQVFHGQLFRNVVFASEMASKMGKGCDWHVVNLVSSTQWQCGRSSNRYSFDSPEAHVRSYLRQDRQNCFSFQTWEGLHRSLINNAANLGGLQTYMRSKSAHYRRAFDLQ